MLRLKVVKLGFFLIESHNIRCAQQQRKRQNCVYWIFDKTRYSWKWSYSWTIRYLKLLLKTYKKNQPHLLWSCFAKNLSKLNNLNGESLPKTCCQMYLILIDIMIYSMWQLLVLSNFFFCHNVFKKLSAGEAWESV